MKLRTWAGSVIETRDYDRPVRIAASVAMGWARHLVAEASWRLRRLCRRNDGG